MIVAAVLTFTIMTIGVMTIEAFQNFSSKKRKRKKKRAVRKTTRKKTIQEEIEKLILETATKEIR